MTKQAARPIRIDRGSISRLVDRILNHFEQMAAKKPGAILGVYRRPFYTDHIKVQTVLGERKKVIVVLISQQSSSASWVLGGGAGKVKTSGEPIIILELNSKYPIDTYSNPQIIEKRLFEVISHEVTHMADVKSKVPGAIQGRIPTEADLDLHKYYNDPKEVRAFMRELYEEIQPRVLKLMDSPFASSWGLSGNIERMLNHSTVWTDMQGYLTPKSRKTILKGLVTAFEDEGLVHPGVKRASGFPTKFGPEILPWLKREQRKLTNIYKALPLDKDQDDPTLNQRWAEARKVFRTVADNLETWIYKVLNPQLKAEDLSWAQRRLGESAWNLQHTLRHPDLFPLAWDYKTETYKIAPWEVKRKKDTNIRRYQSAFRKFMGDLKELLDHEGGQIERRPATEQYSVRGANVVIHNKGRGADDADMEAFIRNISRHLDRIKAAGFANAFRGLTIHVRFDRSDMVAGQYNVVKDELSIFSLGQFAKTNTLTHEIGHRFYYRDLSNQARQVWEEVVGARQVQIERDDVISFSKKYIEGPLADKFRQTLYRTEHNRLIDQTEADEILRAKYHYLARHTPSYTSEPKEVLQHHLKFNIGETVSIEHVTDYGSTNPIEAFAEAFVLYVVKGPGALGPWTRDFFKRVSRGGGAKLATNFMRVALRWLQKQAAVEGDRSGVGLFIRLPEELAEMYPPKKEDTSPPHVTLLYVGSVDKAREAEFLDVVRGVVETEPGPVRAWAAGVDRFVHPDNNQTVFYSPIRFSKPLGVLKDQIRNALEQAGFVVEDRFPLAYNSHTTLEYREGTDPEMEYTGFVPDAAWEFSSIEVWGLPKLHEIGFGYYDPNPTEMVDLAQPAETEDWDSYLVRG